MRKVIRCGLPAGPQGNDRRSRSSSGTYPHDRVFAGPRCLDPARDSHAQRSISETRAPDVSLLRCEQSNQKQILCGMRRELKKIGHFTALPRAAVSIVLSALSPLAALAQDAVSYTHLTL